MHVSALGLVRVGVGEGKRGTNGSVRRSSCARPSPEYCRVFSYAALKKLRTKLREALVSEVGRKGRSRKGISSAVGASQRLRLQKTIGPCRRMRTPRLHLLCADVDEFLDLFGRDIFARP